MGKFSRDEFIIDRKNSFINSARLIAALTVVSRILGLIRDSLCAAYFGTAVLHYFYMGWAIPNLFRRLFGEGALSAALIPVYTEQRRQDNKKAQLLARAVVTLLTIILAFLTLLGLSCIYLGRHFGSFQGKTELVLILTAIMLPYMIFICLVATVGGLLNVHRHFSAPAAAPIVLNICMIAAVLWFRRYFGDTVWDQIYAVAVSVLVAGFLQLLMQYPALRKAGIDLRPCFSFHQPGIRKIIHLMTPMLVGLAAVQINTYIDWLIAYFLSATPETGDSFILWNHTFSYPVKEGSVTVLNYAQRLYHFPLGVFGVALATAIFPLLSRHAADRDIRAFSDTLTQGLRMVIFIGLPASVGMIILRNPLVQIIFQRKAFTATDTQDVAWTLLFYASGISVYCLQQLIVRAFYSFQDSITPVKIAVRMVALNFILNLILIWFLRTGGLALATALCASIQVVLLTRILIQRYHLQIKGRILSTLMKTAIATGIMALGGYFSLSKVQNCSLIVQLAVATVVCLFLFLAASVLLKNKELNVLLRRH